ncbi:putative transporter [Colletotrichum tanaceti]|nr:putative transporter [Colletotrichum tanaceti]
MSETEKADVSHASDEVAQSSLHDPDAHLGEDERLEIERKLVKRLDWILIPWLCVLYLLAFLDRTNIGNAKIAGLNNDLGLSSSQYNSALTIFFVSYAVFEPLTNILLKKLRPSIFIPVIM